VRPQDRVQQPPRGSDRQDRRALRPDFDGRDRTPGVGGRDRIPDGRDRDFGDRDREFRDRGRDFGDRNGNWRDRDRDWRDGRRGDRDWDRDWNRDRNGWANSGWNGRWGNYHNGWRRGSWGWNNWGYRPWWGGYGGWGRGSNLGLALLGLGLGYNNWGWGGYGYPYGYSYGNQWGYGGWLNSGYYYNPYYSTPLTLGTTVIDYSQPLYTVAVDDSTIVEEPDYTVVMSDFDAAREAFRLGDYNAALDSVHLALQSSPNDTALHEFRALVLFAQGNYREAAATLHAVLANGPGWDWATMSALYPSVDVYTVQLRALEEFTRANPDSADGLFVLGYHYMTEGYQDAGIKKFQRVVQLEPKDMLAQRIVESAVGDSSTITSTTEAPPAEAPPTAAADTAAAGTPVNVDVIRGDWNATQEDGSKFNLSLGADNQFTWTFAQGDKSSSMQGKYSVSNDLLILEPDSGPPMIGRVADAGSGGFRFRMVGTPEEDPGLQFSK